LLYEHHRISLGIGDAGERGAVGYVERLLHDRAAELLGLPQRCAQIADLDVERDAPRSS
jgi:hypothetical protein